MACERLLAKHPDDWKLATSSKFLEDCRDGIIGENQFACWLVQDYLFAFACVRFTATLLTKAPPEHCDALLGGLEAMRYELRWFQETAKERGLSLEVAPHPTCDKYLQFMSKYSCEPYPVAALVWWTVERAYNEAWARHSPMKEPYNTYAKRWGSAEFGEYVKALQAQADDVLEAAPQEQREEAEVAFVEVCKLEAEFWDMAHTSTTFE